MRSGVWGVIAVAQRLASAASLGPKLTSYTTANDRSHASCLAQAPLEAAASELSHADPLAMGASPMTVIQAARCVCPPLLALVEVLEELDFCYEQLRRYYV